MSSGNLVSPGNGGSMKEWLQRVSRRSHNPVMYIDQSSASNTAATLTTLHTYTLPSVAGGYFWKDLKQFVRITTRGSFAANANNKTLNVNFGSAAFPFVQAINGGEYWAVTEVWKSDISTVKIKGIMWTTNATYPITIAGIGYAAAGVRLGEGATIWTEANGAGASDVTETYFRVEQFAGPNAY